MQTLDSELSDQRWHGQLVELKKTVGKEVQDLRNDLDLKLDAVLELLKQAKATQDGVASNNKSRRHRAQK